MVIHHFNRIIRNKWVWGVFAVLISMFFAFDFIFDGRSDTRGSDGAGKLGGETVPSAKFDEIRADVLAEMRFQYGREIPIKAAQLNQEVWSRLAMLRVVDDLKLVADDNEVRNAISRAFQNEKGVYDAARYQETCARLGWTAERFEAYIRRQISLARVRSVAESATWVSPLEVSSGVRDATDKITVRVARFQHKNASSIKLDDAALKAYYEAHTNSLALPALVAVRYVKVPADDPASLAKIKVTDDDLHERYDETSDRYGTNEFESVKAQVERDLRLEKSVEAACDALYARVCPTGEADAAVDRLDQLARAEKLEVKESRPFSISGEKFVPGFMVDAASVLPDCREFVSTVGDLDPEEPSARYRAIAGSNAVYVISLATNLCTQPRVPAYAEITNNASVRYDALADLKAKDFKKAVDKVRETVLADLKKTSKFDPKLFGDANVSTSITFVAQTAMRAGAFPDAQLVIPAAVRLAKGGLSELVPSGMAGHGVVVYVEDRQPGDAAAVVAAGQMREMMSRGQSEATVRAWSEANMARLGVLPSDWATMKDLTEEGDADDGEGPQE